MHTALLCGGIARIDEPGRRPLCDQSLRRQRDEIWNATSNTQAQEIKEQLLPLEVGADIQEAPHREDVMILPCSLKPNSEGQLVPHVALH